MTFGYRLVGWLNQKYAWHFTLKHLHLCTVMLLEQLIVSISVDIRYSYIFHLPTSALLAATSEWMKSCWLSRR